MACYVYSINLFRFLLRATHAVFTCIQYNVVHICIRCFNTPPAEQKRLAFTTFIPIVFVKWFAVHKKTAQESYAVQLDNIIYLQLQRIIYYVVNYTQGKPAILLRMYYM